MYASFQQVLFSSWLWLLPFSLLVSCQSNPSPPGTSSPVSIEAPTDYHSRAYLREVDEAVILMQDPQVILIEVGKPEQYENGHLPGAFHAWRPDYANEVDYSYGGMMATLDQMEALLQEIGAGQDAFLLLYDSKGNVDASRLQWILHQYGHTQTALINGGKAAWLAAGHELSTVHPEAMASTFQFPVREVELSPSIGLSEVLASLEDPNVILLDTRTEEEYRGHVKKKGAAKAGRIPGAVHIDWARTVHYDQDFCFRDVAYLRRLYEAAGVLPDKRIFVYCHSGVRSAHTTFVLTELLGYPDVHNYDGSWTEWSHHDLPIEIDQQVSMEES